MAYILALAIGMGSLALYTAAFFFPEVYRKGDFFWSGVGMFYALILWFCAGRITGAVLLGQLAAVMIVLWFGWENLRLRRYLTPVTEQTQIKEDVKEQLAGGLSGLPKLVKTGLKKDEESTVAPSTTPDGTAAQAESQFETDEGRAPEKIPGDSSPTTETQSPTDDASQSQITEAQSQTDDASQSQITEAQSQTDDASQSQTAEAQSQTDESRDANASAEALRTKESEPVKPEKQKSSRFLGLGKIFASVKSRPKKQPKSQPDQKSTSSDSVADETAETSRTDVTTSQTDGSSAVQTKEAVTPPEQTIVPEVEETPGTSAVQTKEAEKELEQAAPPQTEETLTGGSAVSEEEKADNATTNESSTGSAEIKAKTDDV